MKPAFLVVLFYCGVCVDFKDRVLCSSDWPRTHYVSKNDLQLLIPPAPQPLSPECWNYKCALLYLVYIVLQINSDILHARQALHRLSYIPGPLIWPLHVSHQRSEWSHWQFPLGCPLPRVAPSLGGHHSQATLIAGQTFLSLDLGFMSSLFTSGSSISPFHSLNNDRWSKHERSLRKHGQCGRVRCPH